MRRASARRCCRASSRRASRAISPSASPARSRRAACRRGRVCPEGRSAGAAGRRRFPLAARSRPRPNSASAKAALDQAEAEERRSRRSQAGLDGERRFRQGAAQPPIRRAPPPCAPTARSRWRATPSTMRHSRRRGRRRQRGSRPSQDRSSPPARRSFAWRTRLSGRRRSPSPKRSSSASARRRRASNSGRCRAYAWRRSCANCRPTPIRRPAPIPRASRLARCAGDVRLGMSVTVTLRRQAAKVARLPLAALFDAGQGPSVWVVDRVDRQRVSETPVRSPDTRPNPGFHRRGVAGRGEASSRWASTSSTLAQKVRVVETLAGLVMGAFNLSQLGDPPSPADLLPDSCDRHRRRPRLFAARPRRRPVLHHQERRVSAIGPARPRGNAGSGRRPHRKEAAGTALGRQDRHLFQARLHLDRLDFRDSTPPREVPLLFLDLRKKLGDLAPTCRPS